MNHLLFPSFKVNKFTTIEKLSIALTVLGGAHLTVAVYVCSSCRVSPPRSVRELNVLGTFVDKVKQTSVENLVIQKTNLIGLKYVVVETERLPLHVNNNIVNV